VLRLWRACASVGSSAGVFSAFLCDLGALSPAAALREVLFSPQLDISTELRDSSRVLGDLIEFALRRLHALSSSTVKQAGYKALQLALGVEPFSLERHMSAARSAAEATAGYRRTVTRVVSPTAREGSKDGHAADFGLDTSVAAALSTVVSPKNVDVVITIEQELALLDEGQEADGMAGVGDRMDQVSVECAVLTAATSRERKSMQPYSLMRYLSAAANVRRVAELMSLSLVTNVTSSCLLKCACFARLWFVAVFTL
jgi:hypothetical protein